MDEEKEYSFKNFDKSKVEKVYADLMERSVVASMAIQFVEEVERSGIESERGIQYLDLLQKVIAEYKKKKHEIYKGREGSKNG